LSDRRRRYRLQHGLPLDAPLHFRWKAPRNPETPEQRVTRLRHVTSLRYANETPEQYTQRLNSIKADDLV
jgi:hypothetical protein